MRGKYRNADHSGLGVAATKLHCPGLTPGDCSWRPCRVVEEQCVGSRGASCSAVCILRHRHAGSLIGQLARPGVATGDTKRPSQLPRRHGSAQAAATNRQPRFSPPEMPIHALLATGPRLHEPLLRRECDITRRDSPTKQGCPASRSGDLRPEGKPPSPHRRAMGVGLASWPMVRLGVPSYYLSLRA